MASRYDNYDFNGDNLKFHENLSKQDMYQAIMELVKRNKQIVDEKFSREYRNQENSADVGEYENEEEFLEDLDKESMRIKEICRDSCKEFVAGTGGYGPGGINIINEVFQNLKKQICAQGKNIVVKSNVGKLKNRAIEYKKSDSDEMLKKSDKLFDDMMKKYSDEENALNIEMEKLTAWSNANRNMYDNLFGDTINKSSKYKSHKSFDEMKLIIDDKLAKFADYEKYLANERAEKINLENFITKGQKFFNTQQKFFTRKAQVQKMIKAQPSSAVKAIEYPDVKNSLPTSLINQWNIDELNDLTNKFHQKLNHEKNNYYGANDMQVLYEQSRGYNSVMPTAMDYNYWHDNQLDVHDVNQNKPCSSRHSIHGDQIDTRYQDRVYKKFKKLHNKINSKKHNWTTDDIKKLFTPTTKPSKSFKLIDFIQEFMESQKENMKKIKTNLINEKLELNNYYDDKISYNDCVEYSKVMLPEMNDLYKTNSSFRRLSLPSKLDETFDDDLMNLYDDNYNYDNGIVFKDLQQEFSQMKL
ncbi:hypothetical protein O3M35_009320 [Rhynocoris fuscipes]|uniref:Uncharacterized protein n=1 Tax=Rhynocoris fuscipes TaxID=488301 RepID=A0AAW1D583_9HEMI